MTHFLDTAAVAWLTIGVVILTWFTVSVTVAAFTRARDVIDRGEAWAQRRDNV